MLAKGHWSIKLTKVKGHATTEMGDQGLCKEIDKVGNDKADEAADKGMKMHGNATMKIAEWLTSRHIRYTAFVRDTHNFLIEGRKIRADILEERRKEERQKQAIPHDGTKTQAKTLIVYTARAARNEEDYEWSSTGMWTSNTLPVKTRKKIGKAGTGKTT